MDKVKIEVDVDPSDVLDQLEVVDVIETYPVEDILNAIDKETISEWLFDNMDKGELVKFLIKFIS